MRVRSLAGMLAAAVLLAGCNDWRQPGFGPGHSRYNVSEETFTAANVTSIEPLWTAPSSMTMSEPVVVGDRVFTTVFGSPRSVRAYDVATGNVMWETPLPTPGFPDLATNVTASGDQLLVVDGAGTLSQIDQVTGAIGSSVTTTGLPGPPVVSGERVVSVDSRGRPGALVLTVRDRASLTTLCTAELTPSGLFPNVVPTVAYGQIYVSYDGILSAYGLDSWESAPCELTWSKNIGGILGTVDAASDGEIFLPTTRVGQTPAGEYQYAEVNAFDGTTGAPLWTHTFEGLVGPTSTQPAWIDSMAARSDQIFIQANQQGHAAPVDARPLSAFPVGGCGSAACPTWAAAGPTGPIAGAGDIIFGAGSLGPGSGHALQAFAAGGCGAEVCPSLASFPLSGTVGGLSVAAARVFVSTSSDGGAHALTVFGLP